MEKNEFEDRIRSTMAKTDVTRMQPPSVDAAGRTALIKRRRQVAIAVTATAVSFGAAVSLADLQPWKHSASPRISLAENPSASRSPTFKTGAGTFRTLKFVVPSGWRNLGDSCSGGAVLTLAGPPTFGCPMGSGDEEFLSFQERAYNLNVQPGKANATVAGYPAILTRETSGGHEIINAQIAGGANVHLVISVRVAEVAVADQFLAGITRVS